MDKLLELQIQYKLHILLAEQKHNQAYVLFENSSYQFLMMINKKTNKFSTDKLQFMLLHHHNSDETIILKMTKFSYKLSAIEICKHIVNEYGDRLCKLKNLSLSDNKFSRNKFDEYAKMFDKSKFIVYSKTAKPKLEEETSKQIYSYECMKELTKHLVEPVTKADRDMAKRERLVFHNPKMWKFKVRATRKDDAS